MLFSLRARAILTRLGPVPRRSSYLRQYSTEHERPAEPFRVLFCGSDDFSVAALSALLGAEAPLKRFALEHDLEHHDVPPGKLTFPHAFEKHHPSHLLLTASFGHIIPTPLLNSFAHSLNVHPSVLPLYRGAAPVQWAIANGDTATGVTVQSMAPREEGVDAGAILGAVEGLPIPPGATYMTLLPDLAHVAGRLLVQVLRQLQNGEATPRAQDPAHVTRAPKITNNTSRIDWATHDAGSLDARHRAFGHAQPLWAHRPQELVHGNPMVKRDNGVQITSVKQTSTVPAQAEQWASEAGGKPGTIVLDKRERRVLALTRDGWLELVRVKPAGKKEQPGAEWWNGLPPKIRTRGWGILE
ncbi:hypothetical protein CspeluHIS016_0701620 [Cutaneotrichosporon spelunceum]|uniref:methionyl-tRNA formyltransferase n=1 Tax=Cutaneotrichosporon spelunceum TaxID=1672016 RepID=A0AAD3TYC6_9TREE|nr:hypothetical protein CspeluHIS016_0701620 [Cutaneotrichosporon spelunceum]